MYVNESFVYQTSSAARTSASRCCALHFVSDFPHFVAAAESHVEFIFFLCLVSTCIFGGFFLIRMYVSPRNPFKMIKRAAHSK